MTRTRRVPCPQDTRGAYFFKKIRIKKEQKARESVWAGAGELKKCEMF